MVVNPQKISSTQIPLEAWLPMSPEEAQKRGWESFDIILVTGDAYVDHPSFGAAVIGRVLEKEGYKVGIISQPNWRDDLRDFKKLGKPRLFFAVTSGNMDSMVNHYTAFRRLRSDDAYTAGGKSGFRPDYATGTYTGILKNLYPDVPVVIGGIEASMRRLAHYDYWSDALMPSILVSSGADLLVYGMGEKAISQVADYYRKGLSSSVPNTLQQVVYLADSIPEMSISGNRQVILPSYEQCNKNKADFALAFKLTEKESNRIAPATLIQQTESRYVIVNPPWPVSTSEELDSIYAMPFTRLPHPRYRKRGEVPAWRMIRDSVTLHRGCFGGCSFCTISIHQGKFIASRSESSVLEELKAVAATEGFTGVISDLGGPSANMYRMGGADMQMCSRCSRPSCLWPSVCKNLRFDHGPLISMYKRALKVPGVRKVFIGSGIRYDMLTGHPPETVLKYKLAEYTRELLQHHVSGRLKVAPEHTDPRVLSLVRKPTFDTYLQFKKKFEEFGKKEGMKQQLIPYLIASLPGCGIREMAEMAATLASIHTKPEQVQDFTPTPMTLASVMFYTGINPYNEEKVYIPSSDSERRDQRAFLLYYKEESKKPIQETLKRAGHADLIPKIYGIKPLQKRNPGNRGRL